MLFALGAFALYSPLGALIALACFIVFNYYRVSHKVILGAAALYTFPLIATVGLFSSAQAFVAEYHRPVIDLVIAAKNNQLDGYLSSHLADWFFAQIWLSLSLGLIVGGCWCTWKWIRRPVWEDNDRIPGPLHRLRLRRVIRDITADLNGPYDGSTIGVDPFGTRIVQTEAEASAHTLIAGGSGAGKSTTMMIGIRDAIRRGEGVVVIDMKGAVDVPTQLAEWSKRYNRRFLHWSITDKHQAYHGPADAPAFYDPLSRGTPSRKKDLLIGSENWDVEYYKSVNENYLQIAFRIAEMVPNEHVDAFSDLANLLDTRKLQRRAGALFHAAPKTIDYQPTMSVNSGDKFDVDWWNQLDVLRDEAVRDILEAAAATIRNMEDTERSAVKNMLARIQMLRQSTAGAWLRRDPHNAHDINLRSVADEGWVVVFSLDSSNYEATSAKVGGLIIQDLKTLSSELRVEPSLHPLHVYVDEFSAIGSDNILGLLARARDARMPCTLSTQALADLKRVDVSFLEQALGIVNSFIIHRANTAEDAEILAGLTGKHWVYKRRYNVEMTSGMPGGIGTGSATGQGMISQEEEFVVVPSEFQDLKRGQCVYIAKSPDNRVVRLVDVVREDPAKVAPSVHLPALTRAPEPSPETPFGEGSQNTDWTTPVSTTDFSPTPLHEIADTENPEFSSSDTYVDGVLAEFDTKAPLTPVTPETRSPHGSSSTTRPEESSEEATSVPPRTLFAKPRTPDTAETLQPQKPSRQVIDPTAFLGDEAQKRAAARPKPVSDASEVPVDREVPPSAVVPLSTASPRGLPTARPALRGIPTARPAVPRAKPEPAAPELFGERQIQPTKKTDDTAVFDENEWK